MKHFKCFLQKNKNERRSNLQCEEYTNCYLIILKNENLRIYNTNNLIIIHKINF